MGRFQQILNKYLPKAGSDKERTRSDNALTDFIFITLANAFIFGTFASASGDFLSRDISRDPTSRTPENGSYPFFILDGIITFRLKVKKKTHSNRSLIVIV